MRGQRGTAIITRGRAASRPTSRCGGAHCARAGSGLVWRVMSVAGVLRCALALTALAAASAGAGVPSVDECLEGSDFIANAARARDNGMVRERFLDRLDADFYAIRAFPPALRWFAHDRDDETFLRDAIQRVFDRPERPENHRAAFLRACFERLSA